MLVGRKTVWVSGVVRCDCTEPHGDKSIGADRSGLFLIQGLTIVPADAGDIVVVTAAGRPDDSAVAGQVIGRIGLIQGNAVFKGQIAVHPLPLGSRQRPVVQHDLGGIAVEVAGIPVTDAVVGVPEVHHIGSVIYFLEPVEKSGPGIGHAVGGYVVEVPFCRIEQGRGCYYHPRPVQHGIIGIAPTFSVVGAKGFVGIYRTIVIIGLPAEIVGMTAGSGPGLQNGKNFP